MSSVESASHSAAKERFVRTKKLLKRLPHAAVITSYLGGFGAAAINYINQLNYENQYEEMHKKSTADGVVDQIETKSLEELKEKTKNAKKNVKAGLAAGAVGGITIYAFGAIRLRREVKEEALNKLTQQS